jgi:5-methylthioribose kinase
MLELTPENAGQFVRNWMQLPADFEVQVRSLGGGVSNTVLLAEWPGDSIVLKQPLKRLRVVDDWEIDVGRVFNERDAICFLSELLPHGHVPEVRFSDEENFVIALSRADASARSWKEHLLRGEVNPQVARRAGALLVRMHYLAASHAQQLARFSQQEIFVQARINPYFHTAAAKHSDLKGVISEVIDRLIATKVTLIHGDFSPKNLLIQPDAPLMMIDLEIVHYGDPAFDVSFCLAHLILKAIQFRRQTTQLLAAARVFWHVYCHDVKIMNLEELETTTVRQLGCMLLARIDGKSKVEYITEVSTKDFVRELSRRILFGGYTRVDQILDGVGIELDAHINGGEFT